MTTKPQRFSMLLRIAMPLTAILLCTAITAPSLNASGERVRVEEVLENPKHYDGMTVRVEGEAVGDIMRRGEYAWLTLNDDDYVHDSDAALMEVHSYNIGIGVWLPMQEASKIGYLGRYGVRGDRIEITGVFNASCDVHGGEVDIHAEKLTVLHEGYEMYESIDTWKLYAAPFAFLFMMSSLFFIYRKRSREIDKGMKLLAGTDEE